MMHRTSFAVLLTVVALAAPAAAQSTAPAPPTAPAATEAKPAATDLPDRFQIDAGGFRVGADSTLQLNAGGLGGTDINFEKLLDLPANATTFWLNTYWRVAHRHMVNLNYTTISRSGNLVSASREFQWGQYLIGVGAGVQASLDSKYLAGSYRFAAYRNDRFEIGPLLGIGYLWLTAGVQANGSITVNGETQSRQISQSGTSGSATGDLGAYLTWTVARRFVLRGDLQYIKANLNHKEYALWDNRVGLDWYASRHVGVGVEYKYNSFSEQVGQDVAGLYGQYKYQGVQFYLTTRF